MTVATWGITEWSSGSDQDGEEVPTDYTSMRTDFPQSPDAQAAINATLAGLDRQLFRTIYVGDPPSTQAPQGQWLYATVSGTSSTDGGSIAAVWEADLAQGAIAERLAEDNSNLADVITGSTIQFESTDGSVRPVTAGAGDIAGRQSFVGADNSDDAIVSSVRKVLGDYGLNAREIRVLRPLQAAVFVVATVSDADIIDGKFEEIRSEINGDPARYEGLYLEIDLTDGSPIVCASTAYRSGAGRLWVAPRYDDMIGASHGGTPQ